MPYTKPNNTPLYIHSKSNHPPVIIKNLPESINKRLSDISSDEEAFNRAAPTYQKALEHSGTAVARTLIGGGGGLFICSCSARLVTPPAVGEAES